MDRECGAGDGKSKADLVIRWHDGRRSHVEVKIRDQNFAKTFLTCERLQRDTPGEWSHFILLPEKRFDDWEKLEKRRRAAKLKTLEVALGWRDVALALRKALMREKDPSWRVWASSFCGSVEQKILGHPSIRKLSGSALCDVAGFAMVESMSTLLTEARGGKRR